MKIKALPLIGFFCLITVVQAFAQTGTIQGSVVEPKGEKNEPLPFVNVVVKGTTNGSATDFDGNFTIKIEPGTYTLICSNVGYTSQTKEVTVKEGQVTKVQFKMSFGIDITEFQVEEKANRETEQMTITETREATSVESTIGAQEIAKGGTSDVAGSLSKVSGLSVVGSRHVFVRGMGDRYNSAYLNGMPIASPDPDKKVIPLDIFPTNVVQSLSVTKAFTADLYGDFSGGAIDIRTKDYPDKPTLKLSMSGGYNSQSTFKDYKTYNGGSRDFWGIDDGSRDIPASVVNTENYNSALSLSTNEGLPFKQNQTPIIKSALPNNSFSLMGGNYWELDKVSKESGIGVLVLASHNTSNTLEEGTYRIVNLQNRLQVDYDYQDYGFNTNSSALGNILFQISKNHKVSANALWANISTDNTLEVDGDHFDYEKSIFSRRYTYKESSVLANQLRGEHLFSQDRLKVSWALSKNIARSKEPDRRQMVWLYDEDGYVINAIDRLDNHRFYSDLREDETTQMLEFDYALKQKVSEDDEKETLWSVQLGINRKNKHREFDYRQFIFDMNNVDVFYPNGVDPNDPDSYINGQTHLAGVFFITEVPNPASANTANQRIDAAYASTSFYANEKLHITAGVRVEDGFQNISFRDQQQPVFVRNKVLQGVEVLPTILTKYTISEASQLRFTASKTLSRPGFKEVAPFEYIEVFAGIKSTGNPDLINGTNYNADLRYEFYPRRGEMISVAGFGKYLENPIERTMLSTASGQLQSFQNAKSAYVVGGELEIRKKLDEIFAGKKVLEDVSLVANFSYIYSRVSLDTASGAVSTVQTNNQRALQGASPYLVNVSANYEKYVTDSTKASVTLSYNVYGRRITATGIFGLGDIYEMPFNTVNLVTSYEVGSHWRFNFKARNLLNPRVRTVQETEVGEQELNSFKRGMNISVGLTYKFL